MTKAKTPRAQANKKGAGEALSPKADGAARRAPETRGKAVKATLVKGAAAATSLTKEQALKLAEAIRLGEEARKDAESALGRYGQWLLINVFDDDSTEAIENKRANALWHALLDLAGGPRLRLSRTSLHLAVQMAAYDKRLNDEAFRALDVTRKRLLLPLGDDKRIRDAAQYVSATKLTAAGAQAYVRSLLAGAGQKPALRMTPRSAGARVRRAARAFTDRAVLGKWKAHLGELSGAPRSEALADLRAVAKAVAELMAVLQKA